MLELWNKIPNTGRTIILAAAIITTVIVFLTTLIIATLASFITGLWIPGIVLSILDLFLVVLFFVWIANI